jgi:hypothetical protein
LPRPQRKVHLPLGRLLSTAGAVQAMAKAQLDPLTLLNRHRSGDWGDVGRDDWAANDQALIDRARILSAYTLADGMRIWIITEADRSATTILLPDEY